MWAATPSSTGPIRTRTSDAGNGPSPAAQLGGAANASARGRPTLRPSTSNAATTRMSHGR